MSGTGMSDLTAKYVEALIRDGANFDYRKWLRENGIVQCASEPSNGQLDVDATNVGTPRHENATAPANVGAPLYSGRTVRPKSPQQPVGSRQPSMIALSDVAEAWEGFQKTRSRDAVYRYLTMVFETVKQWGCHDSLPKRARRELSAQGIRIGNNTEIYSAVIRCTADCDIVDAKTRSKWSRVLRYVARFNRKGKSLEKFIKARGGINACALRFATRLGRRRAAATTKV